MQATSTIHYLRHSQIDKQRWDECIQQSYNSLIYGYAAYLDEMAPGWHALVDEAYSWVMPLTHRRKYGISYLYQPPFMQQLGVFAKTNTGVPWQEIMNHITARYKFCEVNWNYATHAIANDDIVQQPATNYILDLSAGYETIANNYSNDLKRNLKRGKKFGYNVVPTNDYEVCIDLYQQYYGSRTPHVTAVDYEAFKRVCKRFAENEMVVCRLVENERGELLSIALMLFDGRRLYNMMNTTTEIGRKTESNHLLIDSILQQFGGKNIIFDFEGSDLRGVKAFYQNFAPINQPYLMIKYNHLPWPARLLKK